MTIKRGWLLVVGLVISVLMINSCMLVSASIGDDIRGGIDDFVESAEPVVSFLVGETPGGELLFVKLLVLIILIGVVGYAVKQIPGIGDNKVASVLIQIIVALLATRFLTSEAMVNFIWLPYGALGIILASSLPFIILFFFVESFDSTTFRKIMWIASIVIFVAIAGYRWAELNTGSEWWQNLGWIYMIIAIISFLLLFFDKTIRKYFLKSEIKKTLGGRSTLLEEKLHAELNELNDAVLNARKDGREENAKELEAQRDRILKTLAKFQTEFGKKKRSRRR